MDWISTQTAPAGMWTDSITPSTLHAPGASISRQQFMRRIGVFEKIDGEYVGHIATINFKCKATIKDNPYRTSPSEPDYIVQHTDAEVFYAELGYGWEKKTEGNGVPFITVHLDDPSFPKTIVAVLIKGPKNLYFLYWDRVTITHDDIEGQWVHEELQPYVGDISEMRQPPKWYLIQMYPALKEIWDPDPE